MTQLQFQFGDATRRAAPGTMRSVAISGSVLHYRFVRARRRTIGIFVHRGEVEARAPRCVTVAEVEAFLREKQRWIARRLAEAVPEPPPIRWSDGETLPVLGRAARLTAIAEAGTVQLRDGQLILPAGETHRWRELAIEWLRATALAIFDIRVRHFAPLLGVRLPSIGLSNAQTRWGSCWTSRGETGRILLNWRLVHLPPHLTDYVVAHELAHLRELNHSQRFWAVVGELFPGYTAARRELNHLGRALPAI